jgi:hypothetical protein
MAEFLSVPVVSKNGLRGKLLTTSKLLDDRPEKTVIWETGRETPVPSNHLQLRTDGTYFLNLTIDPRPGDAPVAPAHGHREKEIVVPRIEEEARIDRVKTETSKVRVEKNVVESESIIDEPTILEQYDVQRVPVNRVVEKAEPTRREGDKVIVPVYEEELVKRLVLREEIHLVKKRREVHSPQSVPLRKETVKVQRIPKP